MSFFMETLEPLSIVVQHFGRRDVDGVDRLNFKYTTFMCAILAVLVFSTQIVGDVIKCWTPAQFPQPWIEYAHSMCWISDKYYVPMSETNILEGPRKRVGYYQWVPIALLVQALLFYAPSLIWSAACRACGLNIHKVATLFSDGDHVDPARRHKTMKYLVQHIDRMLSLKRRDDQSECCAVVKRRLVGVGCFCGRRYGNAIVVLYALVKLVYIANVAFQLYALNLFLGTEYMAFGYEALRDSVLEGTFKDSAHFPRVTLCDFDIRNLGRNQPYTVQCTLPLNIFNEKLYIFLWFWLVLLGVANVASLLAWLSTLLERRRRAFITHPLEVFNKYDKVKDFKIIRAFCNQYLRQDGNFMLRMIGKNTNHLVMGELITELWKSYFRNHAEDIIGAAV